MTGSHGATPPDRRVVDETSESVRTSPASGAVGLRRGTAQAFSWTRVGAILAIAALLAAAAYIAGTPLSAGDASASDVPAATASQVAEASVAPSPASSAPEPTLSGEGIEASVVVVESCYMPKGQIPTATRNPAVTVTRFEIAWNSAIPIWQIEMGLDGDPWNFMGQGDVPASGTIPNVDYPVAGEPHVYTVRFVEDTGDPMHPGPVALEVNTPVLVNPTVMCNPDWSMPTAVPDPTEPPRPPAQNGDVIATIPEGDADDLVAQVEVVDQCLADPDTALVTLRVIWQAATPIDRTRGDIGIDILEATTEDELGADERFDLADSYERTVNVRVGRDLWLQLGFFKETYDISVPDEEHTGFWVADAKGGALFAPQNPC